MFDKFKLAEECGKRNWILNTSLIPDSWEDRDFQDHPLEVLSYGGGTQSTAMLLMIANGDLPKPDIVIHADTGSELPETIEFISTAARFCEEELKIPFAIVNSHRGSLHDDYMRLKAIPIIGARSCTDNFKIKPQRRLIRLIVGRRNGALMARSWLGITTDEARRRVDDSDVKWAGLAYPLLDDRPTTRDECIQLNSDHGWEVAKSGCFCCPYAGSKHWFDLRDSHPELFAIAMEMEQIKFDHRGGKMGLFQEKRLADLDEYDWKEDSNCDSAAGCFI